MSRAVVVEIGGERVELSGALAEIVAVIVARGPGWHLGEDPERVETVHLRRGDGWVKVRVEREDPPIRDHRTRRP